MSAATSLPIGIAAGIAGSYRFLTLEAAKKVSGDARKLGFKVSRPRVKETGVYVTVSVKEQDTTRARSTGTHVTLERGDDLPWMLICDEHSGCMEFETKRAAQSARSQPDTWCEWCMGNEEEL
jgi:hypothetical protein